MSLAARVIRCFPPQALQFVSRNQWRIPGVRKVLSVAAGFVKNRDGTIQHGVGKGLRFNAGHSHSGFILGTHKPSLQRALAEFLRPGMTVFDAGANVGYYAAICAKLVGASGNVVCFEPLGANADLIDHNAKLNNFENVRVRREALGDADGTARFSQSAESTWGSLHSLGTPPDNYIGEIEVALRRLDTVMREANLPKPDLIKIDIEGAEADMLKGAYCTISLTRPFLTIELHDTNTAMAGILKALGYEAIVMGSNASIINAPWNSLVLAAPVERADQIKFIRKFSSAPSTLVP